MLKVHVLWNEFTQYTKLLRSNKDERNRSFTFSHLDEDGSFFAITLYSTMAGHKTYTRVGLRSLFKVALP